MDDIVLATLAANIESEFDQLAQQDADSDCRYTFTVQGSDQEYTYNLTILDTMEFTNGKGETVKAIAFQDAEGNIYVHYNGTGDANWGYNSVAYGGGPSDVQTESVKFFNKIMESEHYDPSKNVYVTGHSQGGNNAQYVTMNSEYGSRIDMCMAMDAPGFSEEAVEYMKNLYGEEYFESQRQKIYACNGESDFVSPLGQEGIILADPDHLIIIKTPGTNIMMYHHIDGMLNGSSLNEQAEDYSAFRKVVVGLNEKIKKLPQDQQERIAELAMKAAEFFLGDGSDGSNWQGTLTWDELAELMGYVLPLLAEYAIENPEAIQELMRQFDVPAFVTEFVFPVFMALVNCVITALEALKYLGEIFEKLKDYVHSLTPGAKYAASNPYMKADPAKLRSYATRLANVNSRLVQLDRDLDSLYWQVGFMDLGEIVTANLITSYSTNVLLAKTFLNKAAEKLEAADRKALGYMGG